MITNNKQQMWLFSNKVRPTYFSAFISVFVALIITSFVWGYFSSSIELIQIDEETVSINSKYGKMENPDIAINSSGDTIIVWQDKSGKNYDIYAQYFDSKGETIGLPFMVNQFKTYDQKKPKISMDKEGNFVVVWQSYKQDGNESGIYGQRFSVDGNRILREFKINTYIVGDQTNPVVSMNDDGNFVVVWESERKARIKHKSIYMQRFNSDGKKQGKEYRVNETIKRIQSEPDVVIDNYNNIMAVWQGEKNGNWDIYAHQFDWNEKIIAGNDMLVNSTTDFNQTRPAVTNINNGTFMVVWENTSEHEILENILENLKGQVIERSGEKSGDEIEITTPIFGHQEKPDLIQISPANVIVVWQNYDKLSKRQEWHIFGQALTLNGTQQDDFFLISPNNITSKNWNQNPVMAKGTEDNAGMVWTSSQEAEKSVYFKREIQI